MPVVAAAPHAGALSWCSAICFAVGGGAIHRIDRHPTMARHPVTPMGEADLVLHLAKQTSRKLARVNLPDLRAGRFSVEEGVLFDGLEPSDCAAAARMIWENSTAPQIFAVGSSGFTHGMLQYWRARGVLPEPAAPPRAKAADRLLVLAGSCSPATERQICTALRDGFHGIRINPLEAENGAAEAEALAQLGRSRGVILYSALGPSDRVAAVDRQALARGMGRMLKHLVQTSGVRRVLIAGGDTASHAVQELGVTALTFAAPLAPGAPLCRAHGWPHELELVLKGGQVGSENFFKEVLSP